MQSRSIAPDIEIRGEALQWVIGGFKFLPSLGLRFLDRFGLAKKGPDGKPIFDPTAWYSANRWATCFEALQREVGESSISEVGKQIGHNAEYPMPVTAIHMGIKMLDVGYHYHHRKNGQVMFDPPTGRMLEGIGHYGYEAVGDRRVVSVCDARYPCAFDRGILVGVATRFEPRATVVHDADAPCRAQGKDSCRFIITW